MKLVQRLLLAACLAAQVMPLSAQAIRPLAQDYVVVGQSPDPEKIPLYTPSICRLDSGRLVASYEEGKEGKANGAQHVHILTSDDHGQTWTPRARTRITHGRIFRAGASLYLLGHEGDLVVTRSDDNGETWTPSVKLTSGQSWHGTAGNVWYKGDHVYLVMEQRVAKAIKGWPVGELAPVLLRARTADDLTKPASWTFASRLPFCEALPGYKENDTPTNFFGVPFYTQSYPDRAPIAGKLNMPPMGWLEGNVVQLNDPDHYWYDPTGHTFHLFLRAHTGGTGYAAMCKVVENDDGSMTTSLESVPSGKKILFLPMPGGQMRFHVLYDEKSKLYWLLSSQATDSMTRVEKLSPERYNLPNNERHRLVLHFSKNMVDWCFAGLVAIGDSPKQARHYASMDIDGNDLVILSRSGDAGAKSAHEGNLITFHRVKDFRNLIY